MVIGNLDPDYEYVEALTVEITESITKRNIITVHNTTTKLFRHLYDLFRLHKGDSGALVHSRSGVGYRATLSLGLREGAGSL